MKSFLTGLKKVFAFTFRQRIINKGWKLSTIIVTILCLVLPPAVMVLVELTGGDSDENTPVNTVSEVYVADLTEDASFDYSMLNTLGAVAGGSPYSEVHYHISGSEEDALEAADSDTGSCLALIIDKKDGQYTASVVLPESSALTMEDADGYGAFLNQLFPLVAMVKSGISLTDLISLGSTSYEYSYYSNAGGEEILVSGDEATDRQNTDSMVKEILAYALPFVNIMLLYFLILFYGQGTANSVVMEKTSKLMDTLLLSVRPEAMIIGKVLAQACCSVIQVGLWLAGLIGGFALGIHLVQLINPDTTMAIVVMFQAMGLLSGIFTPVNILFFILFLAAGMLLYLALSSIGGAIAGKQEDLNMTNSLFVMVLVISFLITLGISGDMENMSLVSFKDWIPFTSILVAPSHIFLGTLSIPQACGSLAIVIAAALLIMILAGRIYKAMSLYKGNVPNIKQILALLTAK